MKRSEAVLKISSNLWGKNIPTNSKELAELAILVCEEVGMLPPAMDHYQEKHYNKEEVELASDMIFSWEEEDES